MASFQVYQGIGIVFPSQQVLKYDGTPATGIFTGSEALYGAVWPGGAFQAPTCTFTPSWSSVGGGPAGLIDLTFHPSDTATVWPGSYTGIVRLADFSADLLNFQLTVLATPGTPIVFNGTFTRALADLGLLQRLSLMLTRAAITFDFASPISQFNDPLARALSFMKINLSNPVVPGDQDIAMVPPGKWQELMDIAEVEVLMWATNAATYHGLGITDERWPDYSYRRDPQQLMFIGNSSKDKLARVMRMYGYTVAPLKVSSINLGFQSYPGDATDNLVFADPDVH